MNDSLNFFNALRRPNLMIRAARIGLDTYKRERDLRRLLRVSKIPAPDAGLDRLLTMEDDLETTRKAGDTTYSITRHIEVLTALMAEARLLPRPIRPII